MLREEGIGRPEDTSVEGHLLVPGHRVHNALDQLSLHLDAKLMDQRHEGSQAYNVLGFLVVSVLVALIRIDVKKQFANIGIGMLGDVIDNVQIEFPLQFH